MDGDSGQEQDMQSHEIDPSSRPLEPQRGGFRGIIDEAKRRFRRTSKGRPETATGAEAQPKSWEGLIFDDPQELQQRIPLSEEEAKILKNKHLID